MCSLTHNVASIMIVYLQANLLPREPAIQMHRAPFSACFPACSLVAEATDSPGPPQTNRDRDPTQITSLAPCLKTYVFFPHPPPAFLHATTAYFLFLLPFAAASTARGRAASPIVVLARLSMRCRSGLYHRERAWPRRWRICGESTRGHSGRKGQECGRRLLRVGRHTESGGTLTTSSLLFSTTYFDYALPTGLARARLEGFRFSLYLTWCF
jgi:hypothetical protein